MQNTPKVDLSWNPYKEPDFEFYDSKLVDLVNGGDEKATLFFTLLALCHTVMPETKEDGRCIFCRIDNAKCYRKYVNSPFL